MFFLFLLVDLVSSVCPITSTTNIVYNGDTRNGIGTGSQIVVDNLLNWWQTADSSIDYMMLTAAQIQECILSNYPNLKIFIEPGGNGYNQLAGLKTAGANNILNFVNRNQTSPSAYVGICAGGYVAAHDYIWESFYEGPAYFQGFGTPPPLSIFPHTVEGSFYDISDDQFGTYDSGSSVSGVFYKMVNMSNSHVMLYYGGPVFGGNVVPDYADPASPSYDSDIQVLVYYKDYYGYSSPNVPAAWIYKNVLIASIHAEADNTTCSDCVPAGTIPVSVFLQNRAWLAKYINQVAGTSFIIPTVNPAPIFNTNKPHTGYPTLSCYTTGIIFCDSFTTAIGTIYPGMFQWQRNMTAYNQARPWNVTFTSTMLGNTNYGSGQGGTTDGWAVTIPNTGTGNPPSAIISKPFSTVGFNVVTLSFYYKGKTLGTGLFSVDYTTNGNTWNSLFNSNLYGSNSRTTWSYLTYNLPTGQNNIQLRFRCKSGSATSNYCGIDTLIVGGS